MDHNRSNTSKIPAGLKTQNFLKLTTIQRTGGILCSICTITFDNKTSFDEHYKKHNKHGTVYGCVVCKKSFKEYATFRGHCYTRHVMKDRFKCNHCPKYFAKFTNLKEHEALHALNKYKCLSTCGFECATRDELISHKKASQHKPPYVCQICDVKLNALTECRRHFKEHTIVEHTCPVCSEHITDESHILEHFVNEMVSEFKNAGEMENYIGFLCVHCDSIYTVKSAFEAHCLQEHNDVVYACCLCDKQFDDHNSLVAHCYYHTITDGNKKPCLLCNTELMNLAACKEHMEAHKLETYICPVCGFKCTAKYLTRHLRLHFPVDVNVYQICDKVPIFDNSTTVQTKCVCSLCDDSFVSRSDMYAHLTEVHKINHNTITKRECDFFQSMPIDGDVTMGKRKCTECGKQFNRPCKLKKHMIAHKRNAIRYHCRVCSQTFKSYLIWYKHIKKEHPPKIQTTSVVVSINDNMTTIKNRIMTKVNNKNKIKPWSCKKLAKCQKKEQKTMPNSKLIESTDDPDNIFTDDGYLTIENVIPVQQQEYLNTRKETEYTELQTVSQNSFTSTVQTMQDMGFPREYGPDIIKCPGVKTINVDGQVTDIDEDMPHIDPLLTIKNPEGACEDCEEELCRKMQTKWVNVFTKICEDNNYDTKIYYHTFCPLQT